MSTDSAIAVQTTEHATPQTAEQIATGRQVGAEMAKVLVRDIRRMGLPADQASSQTVPQIDDLVIKGYLLSIDEGSAAKRVAIGFGSGASELKVAVEGYLMTDRDSGNSAPALRIPAAANHRARLWVLLVPLRPPTLPGLSSALG